MFKYIQYLLLSKNKNMINNENKFTRKINSKPKKLTNKSIISYLELQQN